MKRKIAATLFATLAAGTAFASPILASPIEVTELPPPAQQAPDDMKLRGIIEHALSETNAAPSAKGPLSTLPHDVWNPLSAELWLEGIPEPEALSIDAIAERARPSRAPTRDRSVPTAFGWNYGNWKANVAADVSTATASPTVFPTGAYAGTIPSGGNGAINGRLEYDLDAWQFYGGTRRAVVAHADGTLAVNNQFNGGTYYNLPSSLLGGKLGTGFEVDPDGDARTRLEYRKRFGNTEGFLAAERSAPFQHAGPDVTGVNALKAGINRKF